MTTRPKPCRPPRRVFGTMDALRGVAAIAVVVLHGADLFRPLAATSAYLAVDLFYMMSGFVLAHAYEGRLAAGLSAATFLRLRLVRLYPLYGLGTLIAIVGLAAALASGAAVAWTWRSLLGATVPAVLMLPVPSSTTTAILYPLNSPAWSLFYELVINAVWVLLWPWLTTRRLIGVIAGSFVALVAVAVANDGMDVGTTWGTLLAGVVRVTFSFFVGIAISRVPARRFARSGWAPVVVCGLALLLFLPVPTNARTPFDVICVAGVFPLLLLAAAHVDPGPRLASVFSTLGGLSYPLYAVHVPLLDIARGAARRLTTTDLTALAPFSGVVFLLAAVGVAMILDRGFDRRGRRRQVQAEASTPAG